MTIIDRRGSDRRQRADLDEIGGDVQPLGLGNLPMWLKAVTVVGVPGTIAIYLVYAMSNALPDLGKEMKLHAQTMIQHEENSRVRAEDNAKQIERLLHQADISNNLLLRICLNIARDNTERQRCLER